MYSKVHLSVRLPNSITQSFSSNIGLKQGYGLSAILFSIYINDLNEIFDKTFCQPAKIKNLTLNSLLYADDLVFVSETSSGLQNGLDRLQEYCDKWLTINIKKTKTMVVEKRQFSITQTSFTYKNNVLSIYKSHPYLRTIISHNGQFKFNMNELCKKASRAMYTLLGNVSKFYAGSIKILGDLFDKIIVPICTVKYGELQFSSLNPCSVLFYQKNNVKMQ